MAAQPVSGGQRTGHTGLLLDLVTGAETDRDSVQRLAEAAAAALSGPAGMD